MISLHTRLECVRAAFLRSMLALHALAIDFDVAGRHEVEVDQSADATQSIRQRIAHHVDAPSAHGLDIILNLDALATCNHTAAELRA